MSVFSSFFHSLYFLSLAFLLPFEALRIHSLLMFYCLYGLDHLHQPRIITSTLEMIFNLFNQHWCVLTSYIVFMIFFYTMHLDLLIPIKSN